MKHLVFVSLLLMATISSAFAQEKTVVGKWKIAKITTPEIVLDIDNPAETRKQIEKQIAAESGVTPDSAMLDLAMQSVMMSLGNSFFDFGTDGKLTMTTGSSAAAKVETETYTVDYKTATLTSVSAEKKETQVMQIKFLDDYLFLDFVDKGKPVQLTLKKVK